MKKTGCLVDVNAVALNLVIPLLFFWIPIASADTHRIPHYWEVSYLLRNHTGDVAPLYSQKRASEVRAYVNVEKLRMIERVFRKMESKAAVNARVYIEPGGVNASAGNINNENGVILTTGMLELAGYSDSQYAAVIGHELAHIKLKHGMKRRAASLAEYWADRKLRGQSLGERLAGKLLARSITSAFSRKQESNCDSYGLNWAVEAGYGPLGAASLHQKLLKKEKKRGFSIPFLETHPSGEKRVKALTMQAIEVITSTAN